MRARGEQRLQECAAVSGDGRSWYLLNASPDIRPQLLGAPELAPGPGTRETPVRGVILTDAELDHTLGLFSLREAEALDVYATEAVAAALSGFGAFPRWRRHILKCGEPLALPGLTVTPFPLPDKRPHYLSTVEENGWVIGLRLGGPRTIVYAPCFGQWTPELDEAIDGADIAVIDGTFRTPDEMPGVRGHLPMTESLPRLAAHPRTAFRYTHLNNTNPVLSDPQGLPLAGEMELL
jgi:pyrroloquinoline quinone biosynthesis protein B